jgi:hypothetical protein
MVAPTFLRTESLDDATLLTLENAFLSVQDILADFAASENWLSVIQTAFGDNYDADKLVALQQQWQQRDFSQLPEIEVRISAELKGANGAFSTSTQKVYLSQEYLLFVFLDPQKITNILLEEYGHFIDSTIQKLDSNGDEGKIFF